MFHHARTKGFVGFALGSSFSWSHEVQPHSDLHKGAVNDHLIHQHHHWTHQLNRSQDGIIPYPRQEDRSVSGSTHGSDQVGDTDEVASHFLTSSFVETHTGSVATTQLTLRSSTTPFPQSPSSSSSPPPLTSPTTVRSRFPKASLRTTKSSLVLSLVLSEFAMFPPLTPCSTSLAILSRST